MTRTLLATGASWLCSFRALELGDAARVAPVDKLSIVLVAIFGVLFPGERLSAWAWAGLPFIVVGMLLMTLSQAPWAISLRHWGASFDVDAAYSPPK